LSHWEQLTSAWQTAIKTGLAALLAVIFIILQHAPLSYWALVSVAAVTANSEITSLQKCVLRMLGTLIGAVAGYGIGLIAMHSLILSVLCFAGIIFFTTLVALQRNLFNYLGMITGVTAGIVLGIATLHENLLFDISVTRTTAVAIGVLLVGILNFSILFFTAKLHQPWYSPAQIRNWHFPDLHASVRITLVATLTYSIWLYFKIPEGFWCTVSCLIIMEENLQRTFDKAKLRLFAHLIAVCLAFFVFLTIAHMTWLLVLFVILSFMICGYVIGMNESYSNIGNTCASAIAIMLFAGLAENNIPHIIALRFVNILAGISLGLAITYLNEKFAR
jgi:uncharacterized membrane protein YccC